MIKVYSYCNAYSAAVPMSKSREKAHRRASLRKVLIEILGRPLPWRLNNSLTVHEIQNAVQVCSKYYDEDQQVTNAEHYWSIILALLIFVKGRHGNQSSLLTYFRNKN